MSANNARQQTPDTTYDEVLYESFTYAQTHPNHIYTIGRLFGLTPPDFRTARILELGCASGGNILPIAMTWPKADFTGLDLSAEQVALANRHKEWLGLKNIRFMQQDIMEFDLRKNAGAYDYIICHGVFSWVPDPVRDRILELCSTCLSPEGLAVISYNTLPGWNAVRSLREMMLFHVKRFEKAEDKIRQARGLLEFLLESVPESRTGYRATIEEELKLLKGANDSYLFHDHLEGNNRQFYFHEFASLANRYELAYVGDTAITSMFSGNLPPKATQKLQAVNDIVEQEQYMDFVVNRRFRTSILCKNAHVVNRTLSRDKIMEFYLSSVMKPDDANADPKKPVFFKNPSGGQFNTTSEISGALYLELAAHGMKPVKAEDLVKTVQKKLKIDKADTVREQLVDAAMQLMLRGFIKIHSDSPDFVTKVSKKPVAFPFARFQAENDKTTKCVTNAMQGMVNTDMFVNMCIALLDGEHTKEDIIESITQDVLSGKVSLSRENRKLTDEAEIRKDIAEKLDLTLKNCAGQAILVQ